MTVDNEMPIFGWIVVYLISCFLTAWIVAVTNLSSPSEKKFFSYAVMWPVWIVYLTFYLVVSTIRFIIKDIRDLMAEK